MYPRRLNYTQYVASNASFSSLKPSKRYSPWENEYICLANFSIQFYYVKTLHKEITDTFSFPFLVKSICK